MPVTELSPAWVSPYDPRRRAAERRPPREPLARAQSEIQPAPVAPDAALLTPMFRPDLSQLCVVVEPPSPPPHYDTSLSQLVSAVREGDLGRARAAFEALETEMLVERSAGNAEAPARSVSAATSRFEAVMPSVHAADAAYETLSHYLDEEGRI